MALCTQNFNRTFNKLTRRNRRLDANTNLAKSKGKGVVINEEQ